MSINQDVYMEKCLKPNLLPFLGGQGDCIFWPDLARAHYAERTLSFLAEHGVKVVSKDINSPNVPQCRPIEDFLGCWRHMCMAEIGLPMIQERWCDV